MGRAALLASRAAVGVVAFVCSANAGIDGLVANSPFLPQSAVPQGGSTGALDKYELRGVASFGGVPTFSIYDTTTNRGHWIGLDASEGGLRVASYDPQREAVVLEGEGGSRRLFLKEAQIQTLMAPPVGLAVFPAQGTPLPVISGGMPSEQEMAERRQRIIEELRRRRALRQNQQSPATQ